MSDSEFIDSLTKPTESMKDLAEICNSQNERGLVYSDEQRYYYSMKICEGAYRNLKESGNRIIKKVEQELIKMRKEIAILKKKEKEDNLCDILTRHCDQYREQAINLGRDVYHLNRDKIKLEMMLEESKEKIKNLESELAQSKNGE